MDAAWERTGRRMPPAFANVADRPRVTIPSNPNSVQWDLENPLPAVTSAAAFVQGIVPTFSTSTSRRRRDLGAQAIAYHGSRAQLIRNVNANKQVYLKPISRSTAYLHTLARQLWLEYFAVALESREGQTPEESAQATLEKGAKLPPLHVLQDFIKVCAVTGQSMLGVENVTGWTYLTTKKFTSSIFGMLHQHQVEDPTAYYREQVTKAIEHWAKEEKIITTLRRPKFNIRLIDYIRVKGAIHNPQTVKGITSNFQRSQYSAINGLLFDLGSRVGQFVELEPQRGTNEVLRWGDVDFIVEKWDVSPVFMMFLRFHFMKGMKSDDGAITHATLRSLSDKKAYYDTLLEIIAMACHRGVFEEDLESWILNPHMRPKQDLYPYQLTIKAEFQKRAMFTSHEDDNKAMHYSTLQRITHTVRNYFGWTGFSTRCYRYSWAGSMASKLGRSHLNYLMGHMYASNMARTTYQAPGRDKDTTALRHDEQQEMNIIDLHTSVAGTAKANAAPAISPTEARMLEKDKYLQDARAAYSQAEGQVRAVSGGKTSMELVNKPEDCSQAVQDLVDIAQSAWADLLERFCELKYRDNPAIVSHPTKTGSSASKPAPLQSQQAPTRFFNLNDLHSRQRDENLIEPRQTQTGTLSMGEDSLATLQLLESSHPLVPLVLLDPDNAKINVIKYFLHKYSLDGLIKDLVCGICANADDVPEDHRSSIIPSAHGPIPTLPHS